MKTSSIRSSILSKFGCKPDIEKRGKVIVITMPMHGVAQTKRQVEELATKFIPIKIHGKKIVIRGAHSEVTQCLGKIANLPPPPEEEEEETELKPRCLKRASAVA